MMAFLGAHKLILFVAGGLALAVMIGGLVWSRHSLQQDLAAAQEELGRTKDQRDTAIALAEENAQAVVAVRDRAERDLAAVIAERNVLEGRRERVRIVVREIENVSDEDDGSIAPVLRDAAHFVDSLRSAP